MMNKGATKSDYRRKIKTREELRDILGARPRERSVIMCHGTFDLVHPGHIRHLMYAREKADILVASLTSDAHISKDHYRPFVPQDLRAMNLAALEVVDYVITDDNPTPIDNIRYLQPDYFAKGYEYFEGGVHPRTREEMDVLEQYGGEVIFTPGDIVFSSSAFIDAAPPNISSEKLVTLMEAEGITFHTLRSAVSAAKGIRVHVIGDTIVDTYTYCSVIGSGTSKTPTMSTRFESSVDYVGGAAVVAKHLRQAGAEVRFSTVLGDDALKSFVLEEMEANGIDCRASIETKRVTTRKNVFIADNHRLLKVDNVDNRPISQQSLDFLKDSLSTNDVDAYVFSDFRHGIFNRSTISDLQSCLPEGAFKVADSQVASRWGNILDFQGFDLITPNEKEARFSLGDQDTVIRPLAMELFNRAGCKTLVLKLGDRGILTYRAQSDEPGSFFSVDSFADNVVDPVGAGDALLAYTTLHLTATRSPVIASILGSMAAAVACEHDGNNPVSPEDVVKKLTAVEKRALYT